MMKKYVLSASSDEEDDMTPRTAVSEKNVLCQLVEDPGDYSDVCDAGALRLADLGPTTELYLVTIPTDVIDPMQMVNSQLVVGGGREREVVMDGQGYTLATYPSTPATQPPSLFLPTRDGTLTKVPDGMIRGQVVMRGRPQMMVEGAGRVDLTSLRSTCHLPPSDLPTRDFLANDTTKKPSVKKKAKRKREEEKEELPKLIKKRKKTNTASPLPISIANIKREKHETLSLEIEKKQETLVRKNRENRKDLVSLIQGSEKDTKSVKCKNVIESSSIIKQEKSSENDEDTLDMGNGLCEKLPKKKKKSKKIKD